MKNAGYTLVDAVASVLLVLFTGLLVWAAEVSTTSSSSPASQARDSVKTRALCAANLNAIAKAIVLYANDSNDAPPILPDIDATASNYYRQDLRMGKDCTAASLGTGAQQNLCLLVKKKMVAWDSFICPASGTVLPDRKGLFGMGDGKTSYCDYAIQIPYAKTADGDNVAPLSMNMNPAMPILADQGNAVDPDNKTLWSPNHSCQGENVLMASWGVKGCFVAKPTSSPVATVPPLGQGPNEVGWDNNNIYLADEWKAGVARPGPGGAAGPAAKPSPKLVAIGETSVTPTDKNAIYDSVLYSWRP
jgi:hypothetical protein